jgi:hypothetical protein
VVQQKQIKTKALKVVQRLVNSAQVGCFERWRDQAAEEKQMKAQALKVVHRLMNSVPRQPHCQLLISTRASTRTQERTSMGLRRLLYWI